MKCPTDDNKQYIIPTNKWLKPIKQYLLKNKDVENEDETEINTFGLIMLADFIEKEKVIVKITNGKQDNILEINKIIKNMPNIVQTYCSFSCLENLDDLDFKYDNVDGFCNSKDSETIITLEIMKKYKNGSLNKYKYKLELTEVINIIKQLLLAQLHIFNKIGFLHNDIHLSNILIEKMKDPIEIKYKIDMEYKNKYRIKIKSNFIPIISDFDKSSVYQNGYLTKEEYRNQYTLGDNIFSTFNCCLLLLKNKEIKELIKQKLNDQSTEIEKYIRFSKKNLRTYYKKNYDYENYINKESKCMLTFSSKLISLLDENATDDWFDI